MLLLMKEKEFNVFIRTISLEFEQSLLQPPIVLGDFLNHCSEHCLTQVFFHSRAYLKKLNLWVCVYIRLDDRGSSVLVEIQLNSQIKKMEVLDKKKQKQLWICKKPRFNYFK